MRIWTGFRVRLGFDVEIRIRTINKLERIGSGLVTLKVQVVHLKM